MKRKDCKACRKFISFENNILKCKAFENELHFKKKIDIKKFKCKLFKERRDKKTIIFRGECDDVNKEFEKWKKLGYEYEIDYQTYNITDDYLYDYHCEKSIKYWKI